MTTYDEGKAHRGDRDSGKGRGRVGSRFGRRRHGTDGREAFEWDEIDPDLIDAQLDESLLHEPGPHAPEDETEDGFDLDVVRAALDLEDDDAPDATDPPADVIVREDGSVVLGAAGVLLPEAAEDDEDGGSMGQLVPFPRSPRPSRPGSGPRSSGPSSPPPIQDDEDGPVLVGTVLIGPDDPASRWSSDGWRPVLPSWVRDPVQRTSAFRWAVRYAGHAAAFHAVRSPKYLARWSWWSLRGAGRAVRSLLSWVLDWEAKDLRWLAVQRGEAALYSSLASRRDRRVHNRALGLLAALAVLLVALLVFAIVAPDVTPTALRWLAVLGLVVAAVYGRPTGAGLFDTTLVSTRVRKLSGEILVRAFAAAGLCKPDEPIAIAAPIARDGDGWRAVIDLPYGRTTKEAADRLPRIASGIDVSARQVFLSPSTGSAAAERRVVLWVADTDPLAQPAGRTPLLKATKVNVWKPVPFGVDERGNTVAMPILWAGTLVGAVARQGKTFSARLVALAAALDPDVRLHVYDGAGKPDWRAFSAVAHRAGFGTVVRADGSDPVEDLVADLRQLKADVQARYHRLAELPSSVCPEGKLTEHLARTPRYGMPVTLVILDEVQEYIQHPDYGKAVFELLVFLAKVAPAVGVSLLTATQKPDDKALPSALRDQFQQRFCLRVGSWQVSDVILGAGAYSEGLDASRLRPADKGVGILRGVADTGQTVRTYLADAHDVDKLVARARVLREKAGTLTGLAAGESIAAADRTAARDLLEDLAAAWPVGDDRAWSETLCDHLAELDHSTYGGWTPADLAGALRRLDMETKQIFRTVDGRPVNRRGITRAQLDKARRARDHRGNDRGSAEPEGDGP